MTKLETRNHILTVTSGLMAKRGFEKTSMNDIVKESGISKGGIYWHFKNKDEIILAIVESIFSQQMEFLNSAMLQESKAVKRFEHLIDLVIASLENINEDGPSPIEIYAIAMRKPEIMTQLKNYYTRYREHLADLIEQAIKEDDVQVNDSHQAAFIFISMVEGILLLAIVTEALDTLADTLHQAKEIFLKGIAEG